MEVRVAPGRSQLASADTPPVFWFALTGASTCTLPIFGVEPNMADRVVKFEPDGGFQRPVSTAAQQIAFCSL